MALIERAVAIAFAATLFTAVSADAAQLKETKYSRSKSHGTWAVSVEYPQFRGTPPALVKQLNAEIKKQVNKWFPGPEPPPKDYDVAGLGPYRFDCMYDMSYLSPKFLSMHLSFYMYEGGAHGNTFLVPLNYRLEPHLKEISIEQFFGKPVATDVLRTLIRTELWNTLGNTDEDFITKGTENDTDFDDFNFDQDGITFKFGQYQVAPYSEGMPEVTFDYGEIKSMFSPKSPVYSLVLQSQAKQRDLREATLTAAEAKAKQGYMKRTGTE